MHLLLQMPKAGTVPNEVSFSAAISACERGYVWKILFRLGARVYSPPLVDRIWFWVYDNRIPINPYSIYFRGTIS